MNEREAYRGIDATDKIKAVIDNPMLKPVVINGIPQDGFNIGEKPEKEPNVVVGVLFVIYFIGVLIAAPIFAQLEKLLTFSLVGSIFLVLGLAVVKSHGLKTVFTVVPYVGLLMTCIPLIMLYEKKHPGKLPFTIGTEFVLKLCFVSMAVFGVFIAILAVTDHLSRMKRCTHVITATCIFRTYITHASKDAMGRTRHNGSFSPVWQYEYGGIIYATNENSYSNFENAGIGYVGEIRIDPNTPYIIYRPVMKKVFLQIFMGIAWLFMSMLALYFYTKK